MASAYYTFSVIEERKSSHANLKSCSKSSFSLLNKVSPCIKLSEKKYKPSKENIQIELLIRRPVAVSYKSWVLVKVSNYIHTGAWTLLFILKLGLDGKKKDRVSSDMQTMWIKITISFFLRNYKD